ncbi:MAG: carboxyl transferase domain-containing protein, partial [Planctomycetota bacterium]|nr:carboxyl transferase domain-containing protein [Planctomycetota bacterium]
MADKEKEAEGEEEGGGSSNNGSPPDFDGPTFEIERQIQDLESLSLQHGVDFAENIAVLRRQKEEIIRRLMSNLSPWDRVCLARHRDRPTALDYISKIFTNFVELHGDRAFKDDKAIVTGFGSIDELKVMIVANEEGHGVREMGERNFGMAHPEGYRKAKLKMQLAERLNLPIVTFIDTKGAYPGIEAEERGQAMAIAENLEVMARLRTPIISIIIGEGGSGGALGIGIADRLCALENSYFS